MKSIIYGLLIAGTLSIFACQLKRNAEDSSLKKIPVILDTDANNELDDQHAMAYMLFNSQVFDVKGFTVNKTSNGGDIDEQFAEAERIVKLCGCLKKVSIFKGASGTYSDIEKHLNEPDFDGAEAVNFIVESAKTMDNNQKLVLLPIGKLTNVALALKKDSSIASKIRIVWLGTNYPAPGEYNFMNDTTALKPVLESNVEFEMVTVRYNKSTGTAAVVAYLKDFKEFMPGKGPKISESVIGRHGGSFNNFGDYSLNLFEKFKGNPSSRALYDMAAVAIVKNPNWADRVVISAPEYVNRKWIDKPDNSRKIVIWENFKRDSIMNDFYNSMENYCLPE
jgi:inosine-uridine nucleoside N-ribohydrolase